MAGATTAAYLVCAWEYHAAQVSPSLIPTTGVQRGWALKLAGATRAAQSAFKAQHAHAGLWGVEGEQRARRRDQIIVVRV